MALQVFNRLTRVKETFTPLVEGQVRIYVCGPTVYDHAHIGHAKTYVSFDTIVRYLRHRGYAVTYVRNFTDVDDKIIQRAAERGVALGALAASVLALTRPDGLLFCLVSGLLVLWTAARQPG